MGVIKEGSIMSAANLAIAEKHLPLVFARLDEQQRRWVAGLLSEVLGRGGTKQVAEIAGIDPKTVRQGRIDLDRELREYPHDGRVRRPGGGRPSIKKRSLTPITAAFAVASNRRWWEKHGCQRYTDSKHIMIECDGGGCNGHCPRLWKSER